MDFGNLFFSAYGRIGRQEFWLAWVIIALVRFFTFFIPLIGLITWAGSIYCGVCIRSKRLHDMGRTGWWQLIPHAGRLLVGIAALWFGIAAIITGITWGSVSTAVSGLGLAAGITTLVVTGLAVCMVELAFLLWIGIAESEPYDNLYGPYLPVQNYRPGAAV